MFAHAIRLFSILLLGTGFSTAAFAATTPSLTWRGDIVTANSVVKGVAKAWHTQGHGSVQIQPFNTASGLDAVAAATVDIAGSARPSSGSATDSALTFTPVAWDGLVLVTGQANSVNSITLQQAHDIYYGKIANWKEVGGKDAPIDVFAVASPGDGVEYSLRKLLFGRGSQPVAAPRLYMNTTQLEQAIMLDPRGFGVTTFSSVAGNPKIKMLRIEGTAPSAATLASGAYPLFIPLYLVTNPASPNATAAKAFVDFALSDKGAALLRSHSLIPYQAGSTLLALDDSRRNIILAKVGAHASAEPAQWAAAPSRAPVSPTLAALTPAMPSLSKVSGAVLVAPNSSSLKGVRGDAFTQMVAMDRGSFAKIASNAYVSHDKTSFARVAGESYGKASEDANKSNGRKKVASTGKKPALGYRVAAGETLYSIARKHGVDMARIRSWNHLKDNTVRTGQVLRIESR